MPDNVQLIAEFSQGRFGIMVTLTVVACIFLKLKKASKEKGSIEFRLLCDVLCSSRAYISEN